MTDREKAIKGLEYCVGTLAAEPCEKCPYFRVDEECDRIVLRDAYELLKEQNAVEPIRSNESWYCGRCFEKVGGATLTAGGIQKVRHNYCPECGRKVKWG